MTKAHSMIITPQESRMYEIADAVGANIDLGRDGKVSCVSERTLNLDWLKLNIKAKAVDAAWGLDWAAMLFRSMGNLGILVTSRRDHKGSWCTLYILDFAKEGPNPDTRMKDLTPLNSEAASLLFKPVATFQRAAPAKNWTRLQ